jgi:hypothetical protein
MKKILITLLIASLIGCASKNKLSLSKNDLKTANVFSPTLTVPDYRCFKVEEKIEGNTIEQAHLKCNIEKPSVWSR